jgi:hypothetical protein
MSFEGYVEYLCEDGHYNRLDASYLWDMHTPTCTYCARPVAWSRVVDETNGIDFDDPSTLPYAALEVLTPERTERCSLGHMHVTAPARYRIPVSAAKGEPDASVMSE